MTRVVAARIDDLELPLREPFVTSFGTERQRRFLIVHLTGSSGETGIGECVAAREPLYSSETVETARWVIRQILLPRLFGLARADPAGFDRVSATVRGHRMAKAAVEMALWDLRARERSRPVAELLGGTRQAIGVGVSVGIQPTIARLVAIVGRYVEQGYRRVKLKVRPGWDVRPVRAVRREFPDLRLWVDANQAYPERESRSIAGWAERFGVEQVEQPFAERAIRAHARLQNGRAFRVCLDESIVDPASLRDALDSGAAQSVNIKPGRVGGHSTSRTLARIAARGLCRAWVGGMLESGVGRAHNLALASHRTFTLPPDLSASDRYFRHDLLVEPFLLGPRGTIRVPSGEGIGVQIDPRAYRRALRRSRVITA